MQIDLVGEQLIEDLRAAAWLVVVGAKGDPQLLPWLEACEAPTLVVLPEASAVDAFSALLSSEQRERLELRVQWLAGGDGEALWYRYNDARCNGPAGPEHWRERYPNLKLAEVEMRPHRSLDGLLASWAPCHEDGGVVVWLLNDHQPLLTAEALRCCCCLAVAGGQSSALNKALGLCYLNPDPAVAGVWRRDRLARLQAERDQLAQMLEAVNEQLDVILSVLDQDG